MSVKIASEFIQNITGKNTLNAEYWYTCYNVDQNTIIAEVFCAEKYLIKCSHDDVLEWYEANTENCDWVSRSITTSEIIDRYNMISGTSAVGRLLKITPNGESIITHLVMPGNLPEEIKHRVLHLSFANQIITWSQKPTGLVVEFRKI